MHNKNSNQEVGNAELFLSKVVEQCDFFLDQTDRAWAEIITKKRNVPMSIKSKKFRAWLLIEWQNMFKKVPSQNIINNVIEIVGAIAFDKDERKVLHPRITKHEDEFWYFLGGGINKAVKIDSQGWRVFETGLPLFRELSNTRPQVLPTNADADAKLLLDFINISDEGHKLLFLVTTITCFIPGIEHPSMVFHGSKGAAKTTAMEMLKRIVDPSIEKPASLPRNIFDFGLQASQNYLLAYDNLTHITASQSDLLCQIVTGGSVAKRENYTDEDLVRINFQGCVALNGINNVVLKPDLLDRSVVFMLERIAPEKRRSKQEIEQQFSEVLPKIMGGIFSTVSKAMSIHETLVLNDLPRMADYFKWGCSIALALGYSEEAFIEAYYANVKMNQETAIDNNLLAKSICILMEKIQQGKEWSGLVSILHGKLKEILWGEGYRIDSTFPSAPNKLSAKINEIRSDLEGVGIHVEEKGRNSLGKKVLITKR